MKLIYEKAKFYLSIISGLILSFLTFQFFRKDKKIKQLEREKNELIADSLIKDKKNEMEQIHEKANDKETEFDDVYNKFLDSKREFERIRNKLQDKDE